tara:strand:- start:6035 stop:6577 length:543 start_codon:yes stop_codon:yes gene_type:complete
MVLGENLDLNMCKKIKKNKKNKKNNIGYELYEVEASKSEPEFTNEDIRDELNNLLLEKEREREKEFLSSNKWFEDSHGNNSDGTTQGDIYDFWNPSQKRSDEYFEIDSVDYQKYNKKKLEKIADYYGISKRRKNKNELIDDIMEFENNMTNINITMRRKELWGYFEELKSDKYTAKYIKW